MYVSSLILAVGVSGEVLVGVGVGLFVGRAPNANRGETKFDAIAKAIMVAKQEILVTES